MASDNHHDHHNNHDEEPPKWAISMMNQFAAMQQQLNKLERTVTDTKLDIRETKASIRLAYCRRIGCVDFLLHNTDASPYEHF